MMVHLPSYWTIYSIVFLFCCLPLWTAPIGVDVDFHNLNQNNIQNKTFVPTNEWQVVPPGQPIPPGLHVRLNIHTGLTEAKLMDPNEKSYDVVLQDEKQKDENVSNKTIPGPKMLTHVIDSDNATRKSGPKRFRSYEQIKAEFESLHGKILTDSEIMTKLLAGLQNPNLNKSQTLNILQDLEYILHQVDNAKDFVADGGLELLFRYFQDPDPIVRVMVLNTITAAIQGNPQVQLSALKQGLLTYLKALLKSLTVAGWRSVDKLALWTSSCITTLGAQLRNCIPAQIEFFSGNLSTQSGFELLGLASDLQDSLTSQQLTRKLRIRILTLLADIYEDWTAFKSTVRNPTEPIQRSYANIPFDEDFVRSGWCNRLLQSLHKDIDPAVSLDSSDPRPNHDNREKVISAAVKLSQPCESEFTADPFLNIVTDQLINLASEYEQRSQQDQESSYFDDMLALVQNLVKKFKWVLSQRHSDSL